MKLFNITLVLVALFTFSCKSKPKVIVEDTNTTQDLTGKTAGMAGETAGSNMGAASNDMHQVTAVEMLQAERYTYLKVKEKADTFWIAASKFDAKVGNQYFYRGGLLKTNFESQEHKRVFDKIYLVSSIIDASAHPGGTAGETNAEAPNTGVHNHALGNVAGAIKLNELFKNKEKHSGKIVIVSGTCVKVNNGIMGKNWVHIQDGTKKDGKNCDITITTAEDIPLGVNVAFEGKVILNKDFGAGYKYDILLEEGKLKR